MSRPNVPFDSPFLTLPLWEYMCKTPVCQGSYYNSEYTTCDASHSQLYLEQWFSNFLHQVQPQKIFGFPSTSIMTNIKMQYKWLPTAPGVCVCSLLCVCTLDGLNAEHKFRVCHVIFTFSSTIHSKKKFFFKTSQF